MKLVNVNVKTEYSSLGGGLDQITPALSIDKGYLIDCLNYEAGVLGGYRRIDGYERYDGQPSPSDATYYMAPTTESLSDIVSVGDTVTGDTSGATGVVSQISDSALNLTKISGTFQAEDILLSGSIVGAFSGTPSFNGESTNLEDATALAAAAEQYREDISAPTGSGPIRGLTILKGVLYCFRDDAAGTSGQLLKATATGWVVIQLYHALSFESGIETIADGTIVTQVGSGAQAIVKRTVLESGEWGTTAAGRLILSDITGTFNNTGAIQVSGVTAVTASSTTNQISILPGGRYETVAYNFYGSSNTQRIYGADGVNQGFEFDGEVYIPINTGMENDIPEYVYAHKKQLFFSFKASLQNSGVGTPYQWTAISGANEIGIGDNITGLVSLPGQALAVMSRNSSNQLLGSNIDDFQLDGISDEVGCIPRTVQRLGYSYCLDDRGIISIYASNKFGNFEQSTVSRSVQAIIDDIRSKVTASSVYRSRNQYRLYGSDGSGVCMTLMAKNKVGFTKFKYPINVACAVSGEDQNGKDVVFLGDDDGMVYQADRGSSFDGEEIEAFLQLPFNHSNSPSILKTYRKAVVEMTAKQYASLYIIPDFSYGTPDLPSHPSQGAPIQGSGGYFDVDNWDSFFYDSAIIASPAIRITGTGNNMGFIVYSKNQIDAGHKIDGILLHYTPRRLIR